MSDCVDCAGTGQVGMALDGQPLVCKTCGGTGGGPQPAAPIAEDDRPFLPDEECLDCGHPASAHEAHPDGWCNVPDCYCEKFDDGSGYEERTYEPERQVQFTDQDDLGRGIWGQGLK